MKNLKLYEEFDSPIIPKESDLATEVSDFFGMKINRGVNVTAFNSSRSDFQKNYSADKVAGFIKYLEGKNYKVEIFPTMDTRTINAMMLASKIDFSDPFKGLEYGITVLVDCEFKGTLHKACINIRVEKSASLRYDILPFSKYMTSVSIKEFNENNIDMLFWNGEYLVTGNFEHTDTYKDDGMISLTFESYETSDNKNYVMTVGASGSWNAGYDLEEIEDIDFL